MTKSQNTKNEQLTEQWQKGELKDGEYYCRTTHDSSVRKRYLSNIDNENMIEILAPVPSYEEWQATEKYNKHLEEVIKVYERKDKQATETSIAYNELAEENDKLKTENKWYSEQLNESVKEIAQLKELLKECRECVDENLEFSKSIGRNRIQPRNKGLLKRIDEVLK